MQKRKLFLILFVCLFMCTTATSKDPFFESIKQQLSSCQNGDIRCVTSVAEQIRDGFDNLTMEENDSLYLYFYETFENAAAEFSYEILPNRYAAVIQKMGEGIEDSQTIALKEEIEENGLVLRSSEGEFYAEAVPGYYYDLFGGHVSPPLDKFLQIQSEESKAGFADDAFLLIPYQEVYNRVVIWEDFMVSYPDFMLNDEVKEHYLLYLSTLIAGIDNSPVFDYDTGNLLPEVRTLYEAILASPRKGNAEKIISQYYEELQSNHFKQLHDMERFLEESDLYQ